MMAESVSGYAYRASHRSPSLANPLGIGETKIGTASETLSTLGAGASFVLILHDPLAKIGGMIRLRPPTNAALVSYAEVAIQQLVAGMRRAGAARERLVGHVIADSSVSISALRSAAGTIRAQGLKVKRHSPDGTGQTIRFQVDNGHLDIEGASGAYSARDSSQIAMEVGAQVLDLHTFRHHVGAEKPNPPVSRVLEQITECVSRFLRGAGCFAALDEEGTLVLRACADEALDGPRSRSDLVMDAWGKALLKRGRPALIKNARQEPDLPPITGASVLSAISAPLGESDRLGILCAVHPLADAFSQEDLKLLQLLASQATIAVKNAQIYQKLQAKTAELEAILQGIGDGLLVVDPQIRVVMANPTARALLDLDDSVQPGSAFPSNSPLAQLLHMAAEEESATDEIRIPRSGDERIVCQATISRISGGDGRFQGLVAVLRDVTEQREMDRLRSELMSMVSHELRTPLHSISGFVDLILMGKTGNPNELQREFLTIVKQQASQLQLIINDLVEFSRLEYGAVKLTMEPVSLLQLVEGVLRKLAPMALEHRIRLMNAVPEGLGLIPGDSMRLEQVLTNLVDNAFKFTPAGGMVTIGAEDTGHAVRIAVADTGIGIPPEEQSKVFEKYYQVANVGNRPGRRGAGLGLTICKHIVEQHGGSIWVESETGRGSTFYIDLPKGQLAEDDASPVPNPKERDMDKELISMATLELQALD